MLFILNGSGVPSVASIIQVSATAAAVGTVTGKVTNTSSAPISGASVSSGGNGAITGSDGGYTLQVPGGTSTVTAAVAGYQSASESVTVTAGQSTQAATLQIQPISPGNVDRHGGRWKWPAAFWGHGSGRGLTAAPPLMVAMR